jgi:acetyl-CoA carboxylase carboxyl transferase subunit beta
MQKGGIDMIVDRRQMRREIAHLLALLQRLPEPALASSAAV